VLHTGRPVLFVPYANAARALANHAVVGWNGSRESARAVFDALPLLQACETVTVICATEESDERRIEGAEIAAPLARHGVRATVYNERTMGQRPADLLLSRAADLGADMIVIGAYGRSRAREFVFGGVTRDIMRSMTVPTLVSH